VNKTILIKMDGSRVETGYNGVNRPSLTDLQKAVGGYIEAVPHFERFDGPRCCYVLQ
jgi:hypothetical protein